MNLEEAVAEMVLGLLQPERLPETCTNALLEGHDSTSLAVLAGEPLATLDPVEARTLFAEAIRELGLSIPTPREAADLLIERAAVVNFRPSWVHRSSAKVVHSQK